MFLRTIDYYKWHGLWYTDSNMQKWYDDSSLQKCRPQGLWFQRPWSPNFKIGCSGKKTKQEPGIEMQLYFGRGSH